MLQVRKVIEHVFEKVLGQGSDAGSQSAHNDQSRNDLDPEDLAAAALERVEIYCNDQVRYQNILKISVFFVLGLKKWIKCS